MEVKSILTGKRGVSLPFTDFCPSIISDENSSKMIFDAVIDFGRKNKWKTVEFRDNLGFLFKDTSSFSRQPSAVSLNSNSFIIHNLKLKINPDDVFSKFRDSTRRNIKKSEKKGVRVDVCNSLDAMKSFYRLNCATRKKHGLPPQPFRFFAAIFQHIISAGKGTIVLAFHQGKAIAGAVYFHFSAGAIFKYGASDKNYQHLRPNNLVMWAAIKWYAQKGCQNLSFGRTEFEHTGLRQFKSGWGAEEKSLNYYKYDLTQNAFVSEGAGIKTSYPLLKITPLPLLKLAGRLLYRHVG